MKNTNKKILLIAIILSLVTTYISYLYINKTEKKSDKSQEITIIIASRDIPPRTKITQEMISEINIPKDNHIINSVQNREEILGKYSKGLILSGEVIPKARLIEDKDRDLVLRIPDKKRAISISVNKSSGVSDLIKVGDYVDIIVSLDEFTVDNQNTSITYPQIAKLLLQKIQVLAIDKELNRPEGQRIETPERYNITLAVSPEEAEKLTLAEDMGRLKLTLRPQKDDKILDTQGIIREELAPPKGAKTISN